MTTRNLLSLGSVLTLLFVSCSQEQALETNAQESVETGPTVDELQADIDDLQRQLTDKETELTELREKNEDLSARVPEPHRVESGESHWEIAYEFLTDEKGLDPDEARRKLTDAALLDRIIEGFEIWNFYDGQEFGSFATRNDAPISPGAVSRAEARQTREERMRLESEVAELKQELSTQEARLSREIATLESRLSTKAEEATSLRKHIGTLQERYDSLRSRITDLEEYANSVYYVAGTKSELRERGKIERSFLSLGGSHLGDELVTRDFEDHVDLREQSSIELSAKDFDLARIDEVELLPGDWDEDIHYRISVADDGQAATLDLLDSERFRLKTLVIVVSS